MLLVKILELESSLFFSCCCHGRFGDHPARYISRNELGEASILSFHI